MEWMSVSEAAHELDLNPSRVRALVASGDLAGARLGNRWAVERGAVVQRQRNPRPAGRPFEPHNAWGVILLASGHPAPWIDASSRWRLKRALASRGLCGLLPRLGSRAWPMRFNVHPGELSYLLDDPRLVRSGVSAAGEHGLELVSGAEADAYVRVSDLKSVGKDHALDPAPGPNGNVLLRLVPKDAWPFANKEAIAPIAAVALDLAEDSDPRSARIGTRMLGQLDRTLRGNDR